MSHFIGKVHLILGSTLEENGRHEHFQGEPWRHVEMRDFLCGVVVARLVHQVLADHLGPDSIGKKSSRKSS